MTLLITITILLGIIVLARLMTIVQLSSTNDYCTIIL